MWFGPKGFFADENQGLSMARLSWVFALVNTFALLWFQASSLPKEAYELLGLIDGALIGWAAGPRVLGKLTPWLEKLTSRKRRSYTDNTDPVSNEFDGSH